MIKPTTQLLEEALNDLDEIMDYSLSTCGDPNIPRWILEVKTKLATVYGRLSSQLSCNKLRLI